MADTTLRWFGHRYQAPAWDDMPESEEDVVGQNCDMCDEEIGPQDDGVTIPHGLTGERHPFHLECFLLNLGIVNQPPRREEE
jgi:hypothetical protein